MTKHIAAANDLARGFCYATALGVVLMHSTRASGEPIVLVNHGTTLYRVIGTSVEAFPGQAGVINGMTVVPPGITVTGCSAGDVVAMQDTLGGHTWRVDNARSGTPHLVVIGTDSTSTPTTDLAFAHGHLYVSTGSNGTIAELSTQTFQVVGTPTVLTTTDVGIGGIAFDGNHWYLADTISDAIIRLSDPPTAASWTPLANCGVDFQQSDLEWYGGQLWAALRSPANSAGRLLVGTIDLQTGHFTLAVNVAAAPANGAVGLVILDEQCSADFDGDGDVGTDSDIEAFFACLAGNCCVTCGSADFNGDGDTATDADIEAFFRVLAGGAC